MKEQNETRGGRRKAATSDGSRCIVLERPLGANHGGRAPSPALRWSQPAFPRFRTLPRLICPPTEATLHTVGLALAQHSSTGMHTAHLQSSQ